jgi:hypothetical protein
MRLGLHYWTFSTPTEAAAIAPALTETARIADDGGLASFTVMDHYFQMEQTGPAEQPMLEAYTTLGYVAALTRRMMLDVLVTGVAAPATNTDQSARTPADRNRARRLRRRTALPVPATPRGQSEGQKDREHPTRHHPILNSRG